SRQGAALADTARLRIRREAGRALALGAERPLGGRLHPAKRLEHWLVVRERAGHLLQREPRRHGRGARVSTARQARLGIELPKGARGVRTATPLALTR